MADTGIKWTIETDVPPRLHSEKNTRLIKLHRIFAAILLILAILVVIVSLVFIFNRINYIYSILIMILGLVFIFLLIKVISLPVKVRKKWEFSLNEKGVFYFEADSNKTLKNIGRQGQKLKSGFWGWSPLFQDFSRVKEYRVKGNEIVLIPYEGYEFVVLTTKENHKQVLGFIKNKVSQK